MKIFNSAGAQVGASITVPSTSSYLILQDIDGDSVDEMLIGTTMTSALQINIYKANGTLVKTLSRTGGYDASMQPVAYLGNNRLAVAYTSGYSLQPRGYSVWNIAAATPSENWFYSTGPSIGSVSVADSNGDGVLDFLATMSTPHNGGTGSGINGTGTATNDQTLAAVIVDANGQELLSTTVGANTTGGAKGGSFNRLVDLNGDGVYEIVATVGHYFSYPGDAQVQVLNLNGTIRNQVSIGANAFPWVMIADLDGNGTKEIIVSNNTNRTITIYSSTLSVLATTTLTVGNLPFVNNSAADIDGDGIKEILVHDGAILRILNGKTLAQKSQITIGGSISNVWTVDLNNDNVAEIIATTTDGVVHVLR